MGATDPETAPAYALIFNGITAASSASTGPDDWMRLSERERFAQAVYEELRAGGIDLRTAGTAATVDVETLRHLFDLAVDTPLVCSGSFDTDDVNVLRRIAEALGVDPETITPDEFIAQYPHRFKPRTVNDRNLATGEWRTFSGETVVDRPVPGTRWFSRTETDGERDARVSEERADLTCQAGTYGRRCGRPADDDRHRKDTA